MSGNSNLADIPSSANGPPPQVYKTWQMNLLLPMVLPLGTQNLAENLLFLADEPSLADGPHGYTKTWQTNLLFLAEEPSLANGPPGYTKLGRLTYFGQWTPLGTQNLADEPTFSGR